jgi:hypothetical protein
MSTEPCRCGCERYQDCSWAPYWVEETEEHYAHFDFLAMPDIVLEGLTDGYDDRQIDAVVEELIRLRRLARTAGDGKVSA